MQKEASEKTNRLKLLRLTQNGSPPYIFTYDATGLPSKCSYAVDYWGFYNGKTTNISLIPNPTDLGLTLPPANSNDHKAYLEYARAATLSAVQYPTGGTTFFEYELNEFGPFNNSNITSGNGIRIKKIKNTDEGVTTNTVKYSYENGIVMNPLIFHTGYAFDKFYFDVYTENYLTVNVDCQVLLSSSHFASSMLGSGNGVGYGKVTKENFDNQDQNNGKTVHFYHNHPDICDQFVQDFTLSLPLRRDKTFPVNGSLDKEEIWSRNNNSFPDKITTNEYYPFEIPVVYYGARIAPYRFFHAADVFNHPPGEPCPLYTYEQNYVGYYPIYSGRSLLKKSEVSERQLSGPPLVKSVSYTYNEKNNVNTFTTVDSEGKSVEEYYLYPYSDEVLSEPCMGSLRLENRIDHAIRVDKSLDSKPLSVIHEVYDMVALKPPLSGQQAWMKSHNSTLYDDDPVTDPAMYSVIVDDYDNFGNVLQYHKENDMNASVIWGYQDLHQVVKGENISYPELMTAVNSAAAYAANGDMEHLLTIIGDLVTPEQRQTWGRFNKDLRESPLVSQAIISTYSYTPQVGMTSTTDAAGITSYYEYDSFNRLFLVRDLNDNIVKKYDYHFSASK